MMLSLNLIDESDLEDLFNEVDMNKNGTIERDEFAMWVSSDKVGKLQSCCGT